nr:hypothetical protein [Tanacetum cinerariifolium]
MHKEAAVHYANLKASIDDYYDENIAHRDHTDELAHALKQDEELAAWAKSSTNMAWNLANVKGENEPNTTTKDPLSHTKGETDANNQEKPEEHKHSIIANIEFIGSTMPQPSITQAQPITIINPKPIVPQREGKAEQIEAHIDNEEKIKKDKEKARLLVINKHGVIKVVREETKKLGIHPKKAITAKAGEKFKNAQDAKHEVLKRKHTEKDKTNPEELGIQSALLAPIPIQNPSQVSGRKRKLMKLESEIKFLGLECDRSLPEGVSFMNNMVIEEPAYEIFFVNVFNDQAFQRRNAIHKVRIASLVSYLVMTLMNKTPKNARFSLKLRKLIAEHPD